MSKLGKFAEYNGREYILSEEKDRIYTISTAEKDLADNTFQFSERSGIYKKNVSADELSAVYSRHALILVGNEVLTVAEEYDNCYYVQTADKKKAKKFGMGSVAKKLFGKFFPKYGVKLVERTEYRKADTRVFKGREGYFAKYCGKEYSWLVLEQNAIPKKYEELEGKNHLIFTIDEKKADDTFFREKYLSVEYARIENEKVLVLKKNDGYCIVGTAIKSLANKLGLKKMDGSFYGAQFSLSELDIEKQIICRSRVRSNMFREEYMYRRDCTFFEEDTELIDAYYSGWRQGVLWKPLSLDELEDAYTLRFFAVEGDTLKKFEEIAQSFKFGNNISSEAKIIEEKEHYISPKLTDSGRYVIYKGKEYRLADGTGRKCILLTKDKTLSDDTFKENKITGIFSKIVDAEELSGMYTLTDYVVINGERFYICGGDSANYFIELHESYFLNAIKANFGDDFVEDSEYMIPKEKIGAAFGTSFARDVTYTNEPALLLKKRRNCAKYRGREYILTGDMHRKCTLITRNPDIIDSSFDERYGEGIYSKTVDVNDIERMYYIVKYAFVNGEKLMVVGENADNYILYTYDAATAAKLSLERADGYGYGGSFSKFEVDVMKKINNMERK